ncbi:MAG: DUF4266 domain-containing protein [Bacteroidota bacterium]
MKVKNNKNSNGGFFGKLFLFLGLFFLISVLYSCVSVKPYQKMYLNDEDMKLAPRQLEGFESSVESYREGSSGANGGKTGGGCGCN